MRITALVFLLSLAAGMPLAGSEGPTPGDPFPALGGDQFRWMRGKPVEIMSLDPRVRTLVVFTSVWAER